MDSMDPSMRWQGKRKRKDTEKQKVSANGWPEIGELEMSKSDVLKWARLGRWCVYVCIPKAEMRLILEVEDNTSTSTVTHHVSCSW